MHRAVAARQPPAPQPCPEDGSESRDWPGPGPARRSFQPGFPKPPDCWPLAGRAVAAATNHRRPNGQWCALFAVAMDAFPDVSPVIRRRHQVGANGRGPDLTDDVLHGERGHIQAVVRERLLIGLVRSRIVEAPIRPNHDGLASPGRQEIRPSIVASTVQRDVRCLQPGFLQSEDQSSFPAASLNAGLEFKSAAFQCALFRAPAPEGRWPTAPPAERFLPPVSLRPPPVPCRRLTLRLRPLCRLVQRHPANARPQHQRRHQQGCRRQQARRCRRANFPRR